MIIHSLSDLLEPFNSGKEKDCFIGIREKESRSFFVPVQAHASNGTDSR